MNPFATKRNTWTGMPSASKHWPSVGIRARVRRVRCWLSAGSSRAGCADALTLVSHPAAQLLRAAGPAFPSNN